MGIGGSEIAGEGGEEGWAQSGKGGERELLGGEGGGRGGGGGERRLLQSAGLTISASTVAADTLPEFFMDRIQGSNFCEFRV